VKQMHKLIYRMGLPLAEATAQIAALAESQPAARDDVALMLGFIAGAQRGIAR
jgi:UDP-N-acetylglucosamine acyltransferase